MASKKVDPLKAKEAKQKKIAIGGAVLLLALLGFQGPKTLKMLKGPQPVAAHASTSTAPTTATPATVMPTAGGTAAGEVPAAAAPELSAVADSDASPEVDEGQLATFERFASKDPFAQQAEPAEAAPAAPVSEPKAGTEAKPTAATNDDAAAGDGAAAEDDGAPDGGFTTGGSTTAAPELAAATSISVNGVAAEVAVEESFPKDEPTFVLVKTAKNGKSVEIGIAGGEYANGGKTITLALGEKITLQNTVDGSRYELELLTIQGQPVPKRK
jgi:hypothetical protein